MSVDSCETAEHSHSGDPPDNKPNIQMCLLNDSLLRKLNIHSDLLQQQKLSSALPSTIFSSQHHSSQEIKHYPTVNRNKRFRYWYSKDDDYHRKIEEDQPSVPLDLSTNSATSLGSAANQDHNLRRPQHRKVTVLKIAEQRLGIRVPTGLPRLQADYQPGQHKLPTPWNGSGLPNNQHAGFAPRKILKARRALFQEELGIGIDDIIEALNSISIPMREDSSQFAAKRKGDGDAKRL